MASLKQKLRENDKYLFWGGIAVVVVVGLVCWFLSTKSLAGVYATRKNAIEGALNTGKKRVAVKPHPNGVTIGAAGKSVNEEKRDVLAAWKQVYDAQKAAIYVWPKAGSPPEKTDLTPEFQEAVQKLQLDFVKTPTDKDKSENPDKYEIPQNLREQFPNYIRAQFPKLVAEVDAQWFKDQENENIRGHAAAADAKGRSAKEYRVEWPDQKKIQQRFDFKDTPSTLQILYLQEDLWVYKAFCDVIAKMNAGSKGRHDATIWAIQALDIGQAGGESSPGGQNENRVLRGQVPAGAAGAGGGQNAGNTASAAAPTPAGAASADDSLKSDRYVALNGRPLSATDLQSPPTEEKKYLLQYRLMPFKLKLAMDRRKLDELLVQLHDASIPIEVRQVRLNVGAKASADEHVDAKKSNLFATVVEVRGVIYLANPPDATLLKTDDAPAEAPAAAVTAKPAAPPVAEPAAAPPATAPPVAPPAVAPPAVAPPAVAPPAAGPPPGAAPPAETPPAATPVNPQAKLSM